MLRFINNLDPNTSCVLLNAITFDGTWRDPYKDSEVTEGDFHASSNQYQRVQFLHSTERIYINNGSVQGFVKYYEGDQYAFMVLLPNDDSISINTYMSNMTSEEYWKLWNSRTRTDVITMLPEFTSEYSCELVPCLQNMGMTAPFQADTADFSNMCTGSQSISSVVHKTYIKVDRCGTEAVAATAVDVSCACIEEEPTPYVICDRPFAYAIVDTSTGLPVFIGTVNTVTSPT